MGISNKTRCKIQKWEVVLDMFNKRCGEVLTLSSSPKSFYNCNFSDQLVVKAMNISKKYVVNIDFPTAKDEGGHKIHLNPYYEELSSFSQHQILKHYDPKSFKLSSDGGPIFLSEEEAEKCLILKRTLHWGNKEVSTFRECRRCEKLTEWNIRQQQRRVKNWKGIGNIKTETC